MMHVAGYGKEIKEIEARLKEQVEKMKETENKVIQWEEDSINDLHKFLGS